MKLSKEITIAIRSEIKKDLYQEAKTILSLTTDKNRNDFLRYHLEDKGNICCLVLDTAKQELVKRGILEQNENDNFGKSYMEDFFKISPIIYSAIEIIKKCFGGTNVKLLSTEMYRTLPNENCPLGCLGVDIEIEGIKAFLGCESLAEYIILPGGNHIAEKFVYNIIKEGYPELFNKSKNGI